jgi:hypothetical protein
VLITLLGRELTVIPRVRFPFKEGQVPETYTRMYERDYEIHPGTQPRIDVRTAWTNLITYSESISNAAWTKTNLSVTANSTTAPDGADTMAKLLETTTNGEHSVSQAATVTAAAHEVSFFIKGGLTRGFVRGAFTDSAATVFSAYFSTTGYAVSPSANTTAKVTNLGNGHLYCTLRFTPAAGAGTLKINVASTVGVISYAGTTTAGVYLWGAQVALGSDVPYISTTTAARSILAPDRDPRDPLAYLVAESDPEPINSAREKVTRTFSRIPKQQVVTGSRVIPKPRIGGTFPREINGRLVFHPDEDSDEWHFYPRIAVTNDSGAPVSSTTGGTFTVTFGANTTAGITWDAAAGTVDTALDGLASVTAYGGVTVTGTHTAGYTATFSYAAASVNVGSLTVDGGTAVASIVRTENGLTQNVMITPYWDSANVTGSSSFTPAGANPIFVGNSVGDKTGGISFQIGNSSNSTAATGGTFTLTVFGQTSGSLNWNDSIATMQAALNALSEVSDRGNYTVADAGLANGVQVYSATFPNATISAGTFTITLFGQTTGAIAYNASTATIQTAINLLSEVTARGGVTVTGAGFSGGKQNFTITFATIPNMSGSAASLTPSGVIGIASSSRGSVQTISFTTTTATTRVLTAPGHGITDADDILVDQTSVESGEFTVIDANTIALNSSSGMLTYGSTIEFIGSQDVWIYAADSPQIATTFTTTYYLPGVSPSVDEVSDIPIPSRGTPAQLLGAIFSGATLFNYDVGEFTQFRETPITGITLTTINPQLLVSPDE